MTASVAQLPVRACNLWTPGLAKTPAYLAETSHLLIMTGLFIAHGCLHFPEHIAQFIQRFYIGMPANGILGELNVEWVHVVYNWGLLLAMLPVVVGCGFFARGNAWRRYNAVAWGGIMVSFWVQVWHAFEHYAKLAQYYRNLSLTPAVVPASGTASIALADVGPGERCPVLGSDRAGGGPPTGPRIPPRTVS